MMTSTPHRALISTPKDREIRIERVFDHSRDRVWRALTEPELLKQWWGRGRMTEIETYEFRRGGHWRFVVPGSTGKPEGFEGRFREITAPEKLVMTFEWDGMPGYVIVQAMELEALPDGTTRVVTTSQFHTPEERDGMLQSGMQQGMNDSYAALDRILDTLK